MAGTNLIPTPSVCRFPIYPKIGWNYILAETLAYLNSSSFMQTWQVIALFYSKSNQQFPTVTFQKISQIRTHFYFQFPIGSFINCHHVRIQLGLNGFSAVAGEKHQRSRLRTATHRHEYELPNHSKLGMIFRWWYHKFQEEANEEKEESGGMSHAWVMAST